MLKYTKHKIIIAQIHWLTVKKDTSLRLICDGATFFKGWIKDLITTLHIYSHEEMVLAIVCVLAERVGKQCLVRSFTDWQLNKRWSNLMLSTLRDVTVWLHIIDDTQRQELTHVWWLCCGQTCSVWGQIWQCRPQWWNQFPNSTGVARAERKSTAVAPNIKFH